MSFVSEFAEADSTYVKISHVTMLSSTQLAATDYPTLVFWLALGAYLN